MRLKKELCSTYKSYTLPNSLVNKVPLNIKLLDTAPRTRVPDVLRLLFLLFDIFLIVFQAIHRSVATVNSPWCLSGQDVVITENRRKTGCEL